MGLPLTPYFLCLHCFGPAMAHFHFSIPHTSHGCHFSLSGPFRSICFLKTHLFILWACDPLFLLHGLNGFALYLSFLCCPCCWVRLPSFYSDSKNDPQHPSGNFLSPTLPPLLSPLPSLDLHRTSIVLILFPSLGGRSPQSLFTPSGLGYASYS